MRMSKSEQINLLIKIPSTNFRESRNCAENVEHYICIRLNESSVSLNSARVLENLFWWQIYFGVRGFEPQRGGRLSSLTC